MSDSVAEKRWVTRPTRTLSRADGSEAVANPPYETVTLFHIERQADMIL